MEINITMLDLVIACLILSTVICIPLTYTLGLNKGYRNARSEYYKLLEIRETQEKYNTNTTQATKNSNVLHKNEDARDPIIEGLHNILNYNGTQQLGKVETT